MFSHLLSPHLLPFPLPGEIADPFITSQPDICGRPCLFSRCARAAISLQSTPVAPTWQSTKGYEGASCSLSTWGP